MINVLQVDNAKRHYARPGAQSGAEVSQDPLSSNTMQTANEQDKRPIDT